MSQDSKDEESFAFENREDSAISQDWAPEVLQLDELPLPAPDNAEVRLRAKAIGLNRAEVHFRQGRYRFPIPKDSDQTDTYRHNSMSGMGFTDELSDPTNRT